MAVTTVKVTVSHRTWIDATDPNWRMILSRLYRRSRGNRGDNGRSWTALEGHGRPETGGWGGIRTHETREGLPVFKTGAFNRSATHPIPLTPTPRALKS
jgi:hypothetical protein